MTATTWSPIFKSSGVTLSGGNLVATITSGTSNVRGTNSCSGPSYFQVTMGASLTGSVCVGLLNANYNFSGGNLLGVDANSIGYKQDGTVRINNSLITTIQTFAATDVVEVAFNPTVFLIWFRKNGGNWNNDVIGNQNPVGNVGGISTSTLGGAPQFPAFGGTTVSPNQSGTAIFTSGFTNTPPTGYITIDTIAVAGKNSSVPSAAIYSTVGAAHGAAPPSASQIASTRANRTGVITNGWYGGVRQWSPAAAATNAAGNVKESGNNVAGLTVRIFDSNTGLFLGSAQTDSSGNYAIPALGRSAVDVVAKDAPGFQAQIYDRVVPV